MYFRYLDYDVVKMRNNDDIIEFQRSLNRSYQPVLIQPAEDVGNKDMKTDKEDKPLSRKRRSLYYKKGKPYTNRKIRKVKVTLKTV